MSGTAAANINMSARGISSFPLETARPGFRTGCDATQKIGPREIRGGIAGRLAKSDRTDPGQRLYWNFHTKAVYDHLYGQERDMSAVNLADAKAHLSELVDRVETGDSIDITRRGK